MPPANVIAQGTLAQAGLVAKMQQQLQQAQMQQSQNYLGNMLGQSTGSLVGLMGLGQSPGWDYSTWATFPEPRPYVAPEMTEAERMAKVREWSEDKVKRGERICTQIAFWRQIPLAGSWAISKLAGELERICDGIEPSLPKAA